MPWMLEIQKGMRASRRKLRINQLKFHKSLKKMRPRSMQHDELRHCRLASHTRLRLIVVIKNTRYSLWKRKISTMQVCGKYSDSLHTGISEATAARSRSSVCTSRRQLSAKRSAEL